jgi:hypothetical protein
MPDSPRISEEIERQITFHKRWRTNCMIAYACSTIGTILLTAASSIFAAMKLSETASVCAALATVLIGTEKSLMFREKWKLHLRIFTKLTALLRHVSFSKSDDERTTITLNQILDEYSSELPISSRED